MARSAKLSGKQSSVVNIIAQGVYILVVGNVNGKTSMDFIWSFMYAAEEVHEVLNLSVAHLSLHTFPDGLM